MTNKEETKSNDRAEYPDWVNTIIDELTPYLVKSLKEAEHLKVNLGALCNVCPYKLYIIQGGGLIIPKDSLENNQGIFQQWMFEEEKRVSEFTKYDGDLESYCNKCHYKTLALKSDLSEESIIESIEAATLDFEYEGELFCISL